MSYATLPVPRSLKPKTIDNIHRDLITLVLNLHKTKFDGEALDYIFAYRHGIVSHGFEAGSMYEIYPDKKFERAFVVKVSNGSI